jgi:GntR family transcriptional regulator, transcriptional repressor for pyruvate dehydrogenase complex
MPSVSSAVPAPFQKLASKRSFEGVVEQIRTLIGHGVLREGDRLPPERELAVQLGVSRNTVREALRALEHGGVLALKKGVHGGAFIHSGSGAAVSQAMADLYRIGTVGPADLTEARRILAREVARLACERWTDEDMYALQDNVRRTQEAAAKGDHATRARINIEFHKILARASKNPILVLFTDSMVDMVREFLQVLGAMPNEFALASRERMLKHLSARDGEAASTEMDDYLRRAQEIYFERQLGDRR